MRNLIKNLKTQLVIAIITLLFAFIVGEIYCRVALPSCRYIFPEGLFIKDSNPILGYRMQPNFHGEVNSVKSSYKIDLNNLGLRYTEKNEKDNTSIYIGFFGDSFTFGQGVEQNETIPSLVEEMNKKIVSINAGTSSYSPGQEYELYKILSKKYKFNQIVLQLCENDIRIQDEVNKTKISNGILHTGNDDLKGIKPWLGRNSEFFARLYLLRKSLTEKKDKDKKSDIQKKYDPNFSKTYHKEIKSTIDLIKAWSKEVYNLTGNKLIVTYIPDKLQIEPKWKKIILDKDADFNANSKDIIHFLKNDSNICYVDLFIPFNKYPKTKDNSSALYLPNDPHTSNIGNQVIAKEIVKYILPR